MRKLGKIAIVGVAVGAGVYLAQKCMPKMSVFFAHEDDDDMDDNAETEDVKEDKKEDTKEDDCEGCLCSVHAIPLSEAPADVRAIIHAIDGALRQCHAGADKAESAVDTNADDEDLNVEDYGLTDEDFDDLNVEDYGLTDEDFEDLDMLYESDDFEQPDGKFEEPYFTV